MTDKIKLTQEAFDNLYQIESDDTKDNPKDVTEEPTTEESVLTESEQEYDTILEKEFGKPDEVIEK